MVKLHVKWRLPTYKGGHVYEASIPLVGDELAVEAWERMTLTMLGKLDLQKAHVWTWRRSFEWGTLTTTVFKD